MNQVEFFGAKLQFEIDACDLNKAIHENGNMYEIIDARSERAFRLEHIKGAISLPYSLMNEENVKHLDKNKIFVTYCDGPGCNASTKGAFGLSKLNFKVKELIGGIESWKLEGNEISGDLSDEEYKESMACGPMCNCHN
jgi:rhodanese-related sulfurtransferase